MNQESLILLSLVRSALWKEAVDTGLFTNIEWMTVYRLAIEQGVLAIAFEGMQALPKQYQPDIETLMEWLGQTSYIETNYEEHCRTLLDISLKFENNGNKVLLLKGLGLNRYYPHPSHRPCGDIDIYLYGKEFDAFKALNVPLSTVDFSHEKHSVFTFNGIIIENHRILVNAYSSKAEKRIECFLEERRDDENLEGCIYVPSPIKNYIFLLTHMSRHFARNESITIRHLLDWGLFLDKEQNRLDRQEILKLLSKYDLITANDLFTQLAICVGCSSIEQFVVKGVSNSLISKSLEDIFLLKQGYSNNIFGNYYYRLKNIMHRHWKYQIIAPSFFDKMAYSMKKALRLK